jgi:hypothetical protein
MRRPSDKLDAPPPLPLGPIGLRVYRDLLAEYGTPQAERSAELAQLAAIAARAWEEAELARGVVEREGMVIRVGRGAFAHPAAKIAHQARGDFLAAVRLLRQPPKRTKLGRPGQADVMAEGRWRSRRADASSPSRVARYLAPSAPA